MRGIAFVAAAGFLLGSSGASAQEKPAAPAAPLDPANPLLPKYPFRTAKITYGRSSPGGWYEAEAWVSGSRSCMRITLRYPGEGIRIDTNATDGRWEYHTTQRKERTTAWKTLHPGALLRNDWAALGPEARARFDAGLPSVWRGYSPVFSWCPGIGGAKEGGVEKVCGRECVVGTVDAGGSEFRSWIWKGTDIVLRSKEGTGETLTATKIEEGVKVPEDLFREPPGCVDRTEPALREAAAKIFKDLCGVEAKADAEPLDPPDPPIRADGMEIRAGRASWGGGPSGAMKDGPCFLPVTGRWGKWEFTAMLHIPAKSLEEAVGRSYHLVEGGREGPGDAGTATLETEFPPPGSEGKEPWIRFEASDAWVKIVSLGKDGRLVLEFSGKWKRQKEGDDLETRRSPMEDAVVEPFRITALPYR